MKISKKTALRNDITAMAMLSALVFLSIHGRMMLTAMSHDVSIIRKPTACATGVPWANATKTALNRM